MKIEDYEQIASDVCSIPACRYVEGDEHEKIWADGDNCYYATDYAVDSETNLIDGKKYWIIEPHVHKDSKNTPLSDDNAKIVWFVVKATDACDEGKEWNFKTNKPIEEEINK